MSKITALKTGKGRKKRVNIYLDGEFGFRLEAVTAAEEGLKTGQELSAERIKEITAANDFRRCYETAAVFLGYSPRSEPELREKLQKHGFSGSSIDAAVHRLKEQGLVDDAAFAEFWKEKRDSQSPRSRWLTGLELKRKGVSKELIDRVTGTLDDEDSACRAARKKARNLPRHDFQIFRRRLGEHLQRRGYDFEIINRTVTRLWNELEEE